VLFLSFSPLFLASLIGKLHIGYLDASRDDDDDDDESDNEDDKEGTSSYLPPI
jgi:hypothetical protein